MHSRLKLFKLLLNKLGHQVAPIPRKSKSFYVDSILVRYDEDLEYITFYKSSREISMEIKWTSLEKTYEHFKKYQNYFNQTYSPLN
jgi:hypothetical protein